MAVTVEQIRDWCQVLLDGEAQGTGWPASAQPAPRTLAGYLAGIPRLSSLDDLPAGTPVLIRGDVDAKPGPNVDDGDIRLRSMRDTLELGRKKGWKQIVFGHVGRKPEGSLRAVAERLGAIIGSEVRLITDWLDEASGNVHSAATSAVSAAKAGDVLMLENTRRYEIERVLWKAKPADAARLAPALATLANSMAASVARVYVNEALSAGSLDASSTIVPLAMDRVTMGAYLAHEFDGPMQRCLDARLVIFSGLKIDKLDDLSAIVGRGAARQVIAAGSLAMALKKAAARIEGKSFELGVAEDPAHRDKPYYIPPERVDQAADLLATAKTAGIEFVLPVDFVLADGSVSSTIAAGQQQFDVGPKSRALFAETVTRFIDAFRKSQSKQPWVVFHNGVFGMFEDPRFEAGTRDFVGELHRLKQAGLEVYIGGGEGGTSLERYGKPDWVTHCFTAGGTVLNALGSQPVPYLQTLYAAANRPR